MEIGVISDTHGKVRAEALDALAGVKLILHAGDIGAPEVLTALRALAPVIAVRGNIDTGEWARKLHTTRQVDLEGARLFLLHDIATLDFEPATRGCTAVIYGHSHRALDELRDGVRYLNPGSAGPKRFRLPASVMRLTVAGGRITPLIVKLKV